MRSSTLFIVSLQFAALFGGVEAFSTSLASARSSSCLHSSVADDETIPTNLPTECGMDYVPLATMLATEQFEEADQVRRHRRKWTCTSEINDNIVILRKSLLCVSTARFHFPEIFNRAISWPNHYYLTIFFSVYEGCLDHHLWCQGKGAGFRLLHRCEENSEHRLGYHRTIME